MSEVVKFAEQNNEEEESIAVGGAALAQDKSDRMLNLLSKFIFVPMIIKSANDEKVDVSAVLSLISDCNNANSSSSSSSSSISTSISSPSLTTDWIVKF